MKSVRVEKFPQFDLPKSLERLGELAFNIWWVWNHEAQDLFAMVDKYLWDDLNHNPVMFLQQVNYARLTAQANNAEFLVLYKEVMDKFDAYVGEKRPYYSKKYPALKDKGIAYFSFEFGLHESLPVYAGGLGILSGDHLKEASDMGMPLVAVGFIYNKGYFSQRLTEDGWQETDNYLLDFKKLPLLAVLDDNEDQVLVKVELPGRMVTARVWRLLVGRVPLYLLDTNLPENSEADRQLTARLYSSDSDIRISQEILLGMGGVRVLRLLGYNPEAWHMNEGHSAFLTIERLLEYIKDGKSLEEAKTLVKKNNVFTTHTPVPAGNDEFPLWLIDKYFSKVWPQLGLNRDEFIQLAHNTQSWGETFSMPVLAFGLSNQRNAVSKLHGQVSREMWKGLWPDKVVDDVPIGYVTNGVHTGSWLSAKYRNLFDRYLGEDWLENVDDAEMWARLEQIPDGELWAVRQFLKRRLVNFANHRARRKWQSGKIQPSQVVASGVLMESNILTIGFARRFATYKRANLILSDIDRLMSIINSEERPVQFVFSGKAHPADEPGKLLIQNLYRMIKDPQTGGRLVFLEDYDMKIARYMVQGVDVWLNTPLRPNEASGTSGMKAALNGVLNFSVLDGWWHEAYDGNNGWVVGDDTDYQEPAQQNQHDADLLYRTLENEIIPLYYGNRNAVNVPVDWVAKMKYCIRTLAPQFSMRRMLREYTEDFYRPACE
ncbi:MAG: alpha-glucan family phosphorylase [Anaerolineaceae bacterium]|nr:alpha-glucan family phosphorylase [Anaerolineaceae bacterium]